MEAQQELSGKELQLKAVQRLIAVREAKDSLLRFLELTMPDADDPDDAQKTRYQITPQAKLLTQIMEKVERGEEKRVAVSIGPQMGKALAVDTPIPTPIGWKIIGDLVVGDIVFDETGAHCRVVAKTPVWKDRNVFEVTADDGVSVVADEEHEWLVRSSKSYPVHKKKTTRQIFERKAHRNVLLASHGALKTAQADLPVDPYVLGAWLGDGDSRWGAITGAGDDGAFIEAQIRSAGYETRRRSDVRSFGVLKLGAQLRDLGVLENKHIPPAYLRASKEQRIALLQGLVDTDGHVLPNGSTEFCTTTKALAEGVRELVFSLGVKCQSYERRALLYGKDCGPKWRIYFFLDNAARLPRKRRKCRNISRCGGRYLRVKPAGKADTVCIEVDSPSHMFLCGRGMMPTCNSQIISRASPAWTIGRNPHINQILGSYNQDFANEFGFEVRNIINSPVYQQIFPEAQLLKGGEAKDLLMTVQGGKNAFVGVGGSGTGKPADRFVVDDPIRNKEDADSETFRERLWNWFNGVVFSRCHDGTAIVIVHTRWHQDDLIGRLCDPDHPEREGRFRGLEKRWKYFNLPAVVQDPELADALGLTLEVPTDPDVVAQFGTKPMSALWPGRKSLPLLAEAKAADPYTFNALYMGAPAPDDGDYFTADMLLEYQPKDLPRHLRVYGASDHAVSKKQRRDYNVLGCVGVDEDDDVWILPDLFWQRAKTDQVVEELLMQFKNHRPQLWWLEDELISKSFGPFLLKRMQEEKIYTTTLDPVRPTKDKETRARSIQGRMSMKKVHFPAFAPWWPKARSQLLTFPHGTNDDFVDWLSHIGGGLNKLLRAPSEIAKEKNAPKSGSIEWTLRRSKIKGEQEKRKQANAGW